MKINITGAGGNRQVYYAAKAVNSHSAALIIVPSAKSAERFGADLSFFVKKEIIILAEERKPGFVYEARDKESLRSRIRALALLAAGKDVVVVSPISAAMKLIPKADAVLERCISVKTGEELDPTQFRDRLVRNGYILTALTEAPGEFSVRGDIVDFFMPSADEPVRIEFFGDTVDSIRYYDPDSQRSTDKCEEIEVFPALLFIPDKKERLRAEEKIIKRYDKRIESIRMNYGKYNEEKGRISILEAHRDRICELFELGKNAEILEDYISDFDIDTVHIWNYLNSDAACILCDPSALRDAMTDSEEYEEEDQNNEFDEVYGTGCDIFVMTQFTEGTCGAFTFDRTIEVHARQIAPFNGQIGLFLRAIRELKERQYEITVIAARKSRLQGIREYLEDADIYADIRYDNGYLSAGMMIEDEKKVYFAESDIFPQAAQNIAKKRKRKKTSGDITFSDLHSGDYVVHELHGIGCFNGIKTLEADGEIGDYLEIHYAGTDVLYIPTDQMNMVQRYIGGGDNKPILSRLSGGSWKRTRARAKKAIDEIAENLVQLYAEREKSGGYAFPPDTEWQKEFEEKFPYNETADQLQAIDEIKDDMERPVPMDRLLCGDVGYGKTEVAARAIFKCLSDGKQAVMLAPTTLLANQHYVNLNERFKDFPFKMDMLSRFTGEFEQRRIIKGLAAGTVDFVTGTHRLLSGDVKFKDLGLLVVDEEQRFGVQAKEKIKMMRKNVDVLTLSATPIPRTLNMSLTGIKDISMITEPPEDRYPVQTYVCENDNEVINKAIRRELARGGQVFVVYNKINGINRIAEMIKDIVPNASIAIGHGRMSPQRLEEVMIDFVNGRYNILVATTIIENGIDIPNVNTMIVFNADRLGMAQLYQLRGRVGRSNRIAYAYLMYEPMKVLSEAARKRLGAIKEFTEFGAGFKLAMRDLEIRGSGNVLGEAQSGHIADIGYELYCKEVNRSVKHLRGELENEPAHDVVLDIGVAARIPDSYISDETLRLQAYKKIAEITSSNDADEVADEFIDRYGDPPAIVTNLIDVAEIKYIAGKLGISKVSAHGGRVEFKLSADGGISPYALVTAKDNFGKRLTIRSGRDSSLILQNGEGNEMKGTVRLLRILDSSKAPDANIS